MTDLVGYSTDGSQKEGVNVSSPLVNITIPVFHRPLLTQKTILALRKTSSAIPYTVTVVDNGSSPELRERLRQFKSDGIIDNLFLLPQNMGIACACNIGWDAVDAPFYMKLDNDICVKGPDWLERLFALWRHGKPLSTLGPCHNTEQMHMNPGGLETPDGRLGICLTNLQGQCILVPKIVSDVLGVWNEDYGLYGAEDGDYGVRMVCADLPQYYYCSASYFTDFGVDNVADYGKTDLNKHKEHSELFVASDGGLGLFNVNCFLFDLCIRHWKTPRRYRVVDVNQNHEVTVEEDPAYNPVREALVRSKRLLDNKIVRYGKASAFDPKLIMYLKKIWQDCGHG